MTVRGVTGKGREKKKPRKSGLPQSINIGSGVHGRGQALAVDVATMAEEYLVFLIALWRPLIKGVVTEHDVVFLAGVLNADDLLDDIAFRAVHVTKRLSHSFCTDFNYSFQQNTFIIQF